MIRAPFDSVVKEDLSNVTLHQKVLNEAASILFYISLCVENKNIWKNIHQSSVFLFSVNITYGSCQPDKTSKVSFPRLLPHWVGNVIGVPEEELGCRSEKVVRNEVKVIGKD